METLSPPSDADAPNKFKVANIMPLRQKDGRPKKRSVRQAEDMFGKSKHFSLNTVELSRERELETLSPPSDADAPNKVKVANILPPGQK